MPSSSQRSPQSAAAAARWVPGTGSSRGSTGMCGGGSSCSATPGTEHRRCGRMGKGASACSPGPASARSKSGMSSAPAQKKGGSPAVARPSPSSSTPLALPSAPASRCGGRGIRRTNDDALHGSPRKTQSYTSVRSSSRRRLVIRSVIRSRNSSSCALGCTAR
eukprot:3667278-Rhodomonas_salina.1